MIFSIEPGPCYGGLVFYTCNKKAAVQAVFTQPAVRSIFYLCFKLCFKGLQGSAHLVIQERPNLPAQFLRHPKISPGHAACDGAGGIAIAAQGNSVPDCLLQTSGFKKSFESLRHGTLTGFIKLIGVPDGIQGKIPAVIILFQILTDFLLILTRPG